MSKGRKVLSNDHARALIKQAVGMIFGDSEVEAAATIEIAAIEGRHATTPLKTTKSRRPAKAPDA